MFDAVDTANDCIQIATGVISTIKINPNKMKAGLSADMLATDLAEYLVRKGSSLSTSFYAHNMFQGSDAPQALTAIIAATKSQPPLLKGVWRHVHSSMLQPSFPASILNSCFGASAGCYLVMECLTLALDVQGFPSERRTIYLALLLRWLRTRTANCQT